jgi:hypothetical protein
VVERSFKGFGIHEGAAGGWLLALYLSGLGKCLPKLLEPYLTIH